MIKCKNGSILVSACYGALLTAMVGIIIASSVLITLQGIKQSQILLEGTFHGNNIIEEFKLKDLEDYLEKNTEIAGISTSCGENLIISVFVSNIGEFYKIEVTLKYKWGQSTKELKVEGFKYGG